MEKFKLKQQDKLSIKLVHQIQKNEFRRIDLYFSLPKEMGVNKSTLTESEYFNAAIKGRRVYFTEGLHLPLLHTRFASRMKRSPNEYKTNLNLFAFQYIAALEIDIEVALKIDDSTDLRDFYIGAFELTEQCFAIIKKFRTNMPTDPKLLSIFENVDNYISWKTEQSILRMISKKPRSSAFSEQRLALLETCTLENQYRIEKGYNSAATLSDPNRIANKMRLLRRLIEFNVIFKHETYELGNILKKVVTGISTTLIMSIVLVLIIKTQGAFHALSALMIFTLAIIYGVREVFKDDFKNMLWRWVRKGKPKWARVLTDSSSQEKIATQRIWLDYILIKKVPEQAIKLLAKRHTQNKQSAELLHYRSETKVSNKGFQAGYDRIEETLSFSLRPFARYLERGSDKVYEQNSPTENKEKIQTTRIERRYQINVVVVVNQGLYTEQFERYRIVLNRSGIIQITKSDSAKGKEKHHYSQYSKLATLLHIKQKQ